MKHFRLRSSTPITKWLSLAFCLSSSATASQKFICKGDIGEADSAGVLREEVSILDDGRVFLTDVMKTGKERFELYFVENHGGVLIYERQVEQVHLQKKNGFVSHVQIVVDGNSKLCEEE